MAFHWIQQVHGTTVVRAETVLAGHTTADGMVTGVPECVCAILTADCLPVLLCNRAGTKVAAAHAGWRGLASGILEATLCALETPGKELLAWLGPAISARHFEVDREVRMRFLARDPMAESGFERTESGRWRADLYHLARQRLARLGVHSVYGGAYCTYSDPVRFYSYRRDHITGRMASLIWIAKATS